MNSKNEWAANRDSEGIVYCFADGTTQVIRLEDYLLENPEYTAEDFRRIKEASDDLYYERFQSDVLYGNKTSDTDFDTIAAMLPAPDPEPCLKVVHREQRRLAVRAALTLLHSGTLSWIHWRWHEWAAPGKRSKGNWNGQDWSPLSTSEWKHCNISNAAAG